jgi:hypothetical protein
LLCSPVDQRARPRLHGGERVGLVNLTPEGALQLELPRVVFAATTRISKRTVEHGFELASVVIEPEQRRLIMSWHSALLVRAPEVDDLRSSRIREVRA